MAADPDVALAAGDLSGKAQPRLGLEPQRLVEQLWRIEEGVAVQPAEPRKLGVLEPGNGAEDADLFAVAELGLEAHHVEQCAELVVLAQLHHRVRLALRPPRVGEAERLHWPVAQCFAPALGHDFDRQAAVEIGRRDFEVLECRLLAGQQGIDERLVLFARERAIDVIGAGTAGPGLVVARLNQTTSKSIELRCTIGAIASKRRARPRRCSSRIASASAGEVSGPVAMITLSHSAGGAPISARCDLDERFGFERRRDLRGKAVAVDRERAAGGQLVGIGGTHDQRAAAGAFRHAARRSRCPRHRRSGTSSNRRVRRIVRFYEPAWRAADAFRAAPRARRARDLPRRFRARESAADDVNRATQILPQILHHAALIRRPGAKKQRQGTNTGRTRTVPVFIPITVAWGPCMLDFAKSAPRDTVAAGFDVEVLSVATANPPYQLHQAEAAARARELYPHLKKLWRLYDNTCIETRYNCEPIEWYLRPHSWEERTASFQKTRSIFWKS